VADIPGIDVSHHQQTIDWPAVASSGIQFGFIKATEGTHVVDPQFLHNWQGSANAGVLRGAYHFFHPELPALAQATTFIHTVGHLRPGDLPPALDLEVPASWTNIPVADRAPLALAWLETVESQLGVRPLIYLSPAFAIEILNNARYDSGGAARTEAVDFLGILAIQRRRQGAGN
jgi:lysozyme